MTSENELIQIDGIVISKETQIETIQTSEVVNLTINQNYLEETDFIIIAGEDVGGHKAIAMIDGLAYLADKDSPLHFNKVVGMSANAALAGDSVTIKKGTKIILNGWGLVPDSVYFLGNNGNISVSTYDGIFQIIGIAKDASTLLIQLSNPIKR